MPDPVFDVHSHPLFPAFVDALAGGSVRGADGQPSAHGVALPAWSVEQHVEMMDRHGIDVCVLSVNGVTDHMAGPGGHALARSLNEELASLVARHPTRFAALAAVPMDDMDAAIEAAAYALDILKLDGLSASTHYKGRYLGEPEYDAWFDEMNRRGATLFVHPSAPAYFDAETSKINVSVLEFMFDTTRMVTTMVLSGAKQRFDRINIIATHGGGTIPFLAQRIGLAGEMPWAYRGGPRLTLAQILASLGSFYFDLTASTSPASLEAIHRLVPADRLLLGFDFPLMPERSIAPALAAFAASAQFGASERRKISFENAVRLFPRFG